MSLDLKNEQKLENHTVDVRLLIDVPCDSEKEAIQWVRDNITLLIGDNLKLSQNRFTPKQSHYLASVESRLIKNVTKLYNLIDLLKSHRLL